MAKLAKSILLQITPTGTKLVIDDEEFPFHIAAEDIVLQGKADGFSFARVTILAEQITVSADLGQPETVDALAEIHEAVGLGDEPAGTPLGSRFSVLPETPTPPADVLALKQVDGKYGENLPFLVRHPDNPYRWRWMGEPDATDFDPGQPWHYWMNPGYEWHGATLEVVSVKN